MRLATIHGRPTSRPPMTDFEALLMEIQETPYPDLSNRQRYRLKLLIELEHREREQIRFAPINERK